MEITTITLSISSVVLLLAAVSPMVSPLFRLPKRDEKDSAAIGENKDKPISVVIISHDNAPELEKHLPAFLSQKYDADYQVIVVADKSDSETDDVIKRFSNDPHLYATFMPLSSRYISRKKLAITLGIKAAKYPWAIVTDACLTSMTILMWCSATLTMKRMLLRTFTTRTSLMPHRTSVVHRRTTHTPRPQGLWL